MLKASEPVHLNGSRITQICTLMQHILSSSLAQISLEGAVSLILNFPLSLALEIEEGIEFVLPTKAQHFRMANVL